MKKKLILSIGFVFIISNCFSQDFITTWQTINNSNFIRFGAETTGSVSYNWQTVSTTAPISGAGTFIGPLVTISGLPRNQKIRLSIQPQNLKRFFNNDSFSGFVFALENVNQWGKVEWSSMENAFSFYPTLQVSATDIPNLSNVKSMKNMFEDSGSLNSPFNINAWNISNVTNISGMFKNCTNFNQALSVWNTSNVTDMSSLFEGAKAFNQNLGNWNTSKVNNMSNLFKGALSFNRNISNWNTANVTNMAGMFEGDFNTGFQYLFNQNISNWNTANVQSMARMFQGASAFNQNIGNWNTSNVTDMSDMFNQAFSFNQNIGNWNTANVTNMARMFASDPIGIVLSFPTITLFNNGGTTTIQNWNTSKVTDMTRMFFRAEKFNHNLGNWSLNTNVILNEMLDSSGLDCKNYSQTIIGWNNNPNTPNNKILGATFLGYGPEAVEAINNLVFNKQWGFSGHDFFSETPQFNINNSYCERATIPSLPNTSDQGISGAWSPALNSNETTTYTFTPQPGQCATSATTTITINPSPMLTGNANQSFNTNSTLADIVLNPANVIWYATAIDANNNTNQLPLSTIIQDGFSYYAVNDNGQCRSIPFLVKVTFNLSVNNNDFISFKYYPNPVSSNLFISAKNAIKNVEVYNLLGQLLINKIFDDTTISIALNELTAATYLVKVRAENLSREFKIIKQ